MKGFSFYKKHYGQKHFGQKHHNGGQNGNRSTWGYLPRTSSRYRNLGSLSYFNFNRDSQFRSIEIFNPN